MSNETKAYVDFSKVVNFESIDIELQKELREVQSQLNLTPSVKNSRTQKWEASPTNVAVQKYWELSIRKIQSMIKQGLSYSSADYYIYCQFGGKPSVTKSPNGMIKAMNKLASLQGFLANINTGCVYQGYDELKVVRNGLIDTLHLVNTAESEVKQNGESDILAPYAVVTLINKQSWETVSRKVTIIRNNEYLKAKSQGSATHKYYPVPMAEKIALKRAAEQMSASLGIDDSVETSALRGEIEDHNSEYDMDKVHQDEPVAETLDPHYPSDQFKKNLPDWEKRIQSGDKSAKQFIAFANKRIPFSLEQQKQLKDIEVK